MLPPQSQLGHYLILRSLGSGGMADVYEAEDQRLGRRVALKTLPPELGRNPELVQRFEKEVRAAAQLNHRGIVTVFEVGSADGCHYYSMRLLTGGDLRSHMKRGLNHDEILAILRELADAFGHAHERGFVHRDMKPENVIFDEQGYPVLTDFGIAKALDRTTDSNATLVGITLGTPRYVSPEQARGKTVDARSDLYSLGVVFYEMLTGQPPFDGEDPLSVLFKHASDPVPRLAPELAKFQPMIDALLAKDPAQRVASGDALIALIDALPSAEPADFLRTIEMTAFPELMKGSALKPAALKAAAPAADPAVARREAEARAREAQAKAAAVAAAASAAAAQKRAEDAAREKARAEQAAAERDRERERAEQQRQEAARRKLEQEEKARAEAEHREAQRREQLARAAVEAEREAEQEAQRREQAQAERRAREEQERIAAAKREQARLAEESRRAEAAARKAAEKAADDARRQLEKEEKARLAAEQRAARQREKAEQESRALAAREQRDREAEAQRQQQAALKAEAAARKAEERARKQAEERARKQAEDLPWPVDAQGASGSDESLARTAAPAPLWKRPAVLAGGAAALVALLAFALWPRLDDAPVSPDPARAPASITQKSLPPAVAKPAPAPASTAVSPALPPVTGAAPTPKPPASVDPAAANALPNPLPQTVAPTPATSPPQIVAPPPAAPATATPAPAKPRTVAPAVKPAPAIPKPKPAPVKPPASRSTAPSAPQQSGWVSEDQAISGLLAEGRAAYQRGEYQSAISYAESVLFFEPGNVAAKRLLSDVQKARAGGR